MVSNTSLRPAVTSSKLHCHRFGRSGILTHLGNLPITRDIHIGGIQRCNGRAAE